MGPVGSRRRAPQPPSGFIFIIDFDGVYLTDDDGYYLMEAV